MKFKTGDRVRIFTTGFVLNYSARPNGPDDLGDKIRIKFNDDPNRWAWFSVEDVRPLEPTLVVTKPEDEWRAIAADAILNGKDRDALVLIGENSPTHSSEMLTNIASTREYLFALEAYYDIFASPPAVAAKSRPAWEHVQALRAKRFRAESTPEGLDALTKMERARTALREVAWRYIQAGRDITIGLELDQAALVYSQAREAYEAVKPPVDDGIARCTKCRWPLAASADQGCVPGNCSYRP